MKIMLVDDERLVLEDLISIIDWKMIGFDEIYIAENTESAKQIIDQNHPEIILCDIEMPGTGGIALLEWCKENNPESEVIMLTSHASFEYAQSAIHLGCFDYILKPVDDSILSDVISRAMKKNRETHAVNLLRQKEILHNKRHNELEGVFWDYLLAERLSGNESEWISTAKALGIRISEGTGYLLVLIQLHDETQTTGPDGSIKGDSVINKIFSGNGMERCELPPDGNNVFYVAWNMDGLGRTRYPEQKTAGLPYAVYYKNAQSLGALIQAKKELMRISSENLYLKTGLYGVDFSVPNEQSQIDLPDFTEWDNYVNSIDIKKIEMELHQWLLNPTTQAGLTRAVLSQLQNDFEQWVYRVLQSREVKANRVLYSNEVLKSRFEALNSVKSMQKWIREVLCQLEGIIMNLSKDNNIVNQVKAFVRENVKDEITRVDIAEALFLNADYLDRVFKRQTGESVNRYLLRKKIELAKSLLASDTAQISEVAMECGYTNQSSFTVMFKRETGMTPYEFRKMKNH